MDGGARDHHLQAVPQDGERIRSLSGAARGLVSHLDLDAVLDGLLEAACDFTGARYAAIGVLTPDKHELERFVTRGIDEETHRRIGDLPRGRGILGLLIQDPRPLRLGSVRRHPQSYGFPAGHPPMESFLGVPILIRGEPWGNLYLTEKRGGEFTDDDEGVAVLLADWAAIAIHNARLFEESDAQRRDLERANRALEVTTDIAKAVGGETDLDRILELIVKRARALVDARALLIVLGEAGNLVVAAAAGDLDPEVTGTRLPISGNPTEQIMRSQRAMRVDDLQLTTGWARAGLGADAHSALAVPLLFRRRSLGVLIALDRLGDESSFTAEQERLLGAFAASAATAVATARAASDERVRGAIDAGEQERRRWARELHDEALQELAALSIDLTSTMRHGDEAALRAGMQRAAEQVQRQIAALRNLISDLRPADLDELGLGAALEELGERLRVRDGLTVHLDLDMAWERGSAVGRLAGAVETTAYRLVQEALTNVVKHAAAGSAVVRLRESASELVVEITDDGHGFDPDAVDGGFGLAGMRERAELLGGTLSIASSSGGTTVRATLPARRAEPVDRLAG